MSYEIVKSIKIDEKEKKVFVTCCSNNVRPHTMRREEGGYLSRILVEKGRRAVEKIILEGYISGNFQGGSNKYTRALQFLRHSSDFVPFDYRQNWDGYEREKIENAEKYEKLLDEALDCKLPKERFVLTKKMLGYGDVYGKKMRLYMHWTSNKEKATKYRYREDAKFALKCFKWSGETPTIMDIFG